MRRQVSLFDQSTIEVPAFGVRICRHFGSLNEFQRKRNRACQGNRQGHGCAQQKYSKRLLEVPRIAMRRLLGRLDNKPVDAIAEIEVVTMRTRHARTFSVPLACAGAPCRVEIDHGTGRSLADVLKPRCRRWGRHRPTGMHCLGSSTFRLGRGCEDGKRQKISAALCDLIELTRDRGVPRQCTEPFTIIELNPSDLPLRRL